MNKNNSPIADKFIELLNIIKKLRSPEGCSWDRKQTSESLIPYLLEETYEVIEAIEEKNVEILKEELGDLILHILFQSELANELGQFSIEDSLKNVSEKLIRRHPHVFEKNNDISKEDINKSWELSKQKEKSRINVLDGVPKALPALVRANRIQEKAANVGFDWKELTPVINKLEEEILELKEAIELKKSENIKVRWRMFDLKYSSINCIFVCFQY